MEIPQWMQPKSWRPKEWENPYLAKNVYGKTIPNNNYDSYEEGADAMLEALAKESDGKKIWFGRTNDNDILVHIGI